MIRPRKQQWVLGSFLMLCSVSACDCDDDDLPPDEVYAYAKPGVDFDDFKTFRIEDHLDEDALEDAGVDPDKIPDDVRYNIDTANHQAAVELEDRGLTEVGEDEEADLIIGSVGKVDEQGGVYWECVPGYWWGWYGWYWDSCAWLEPEYVEFKVGSLALGLNAPGEDDVVFFGFLQGVGTGGGEDEVARRIEDGVHEMFKEYPVDPE
jgi:hypothetical protein